MFCGIILRVVLQPADTGLFRVINSSHFPLVDELMLPVTYCGNSLILVLASLTLLFYGRKKDFAAAIVSILLSGIMISLVKLVFPAARPYTLVEGVNILGPVLRSYSFPSGHTAAIFSLYALAGSVKYRKIFPLFVTVAIMVGISRIYVGVHFPSDVLFGAGLGCVTGYVVKSILKIERKNANVKNQINQGA